MNKLAPAVAASLAILVACNDPGAGAGSSTASSKPAATSAKPSASAFAATATASTTTSASSVPAASGSAATSAEAAGSASGAASAEPAIGVAECDAYIKVMNDCFLPKQSPGARTTEDEVLGQKVEAWTKAAATAPGKTGLAKVCKQEADMWKDKLAGAGCKMP